MRPHKRQAFAKGTVRMTRTGTTEATEREDPSCRPLPLRGSARGAPPLITPLSAAADRSRARRARGARHRPNQGTALRWQTRTRHTARCPPPPAIHTPWPCPWQRCPLARPSARTKCVRDQKSHGTDGTGVPIVPLRTERTDVGRTPPPPMAQSSPDEASIPPNRRDTDMVRRGDDGGEDPMRRDISHRHAVRLAGSVPESRRFDRLVKRHGRLSRISL